MVTQFGVCSVYALFVAENLRAVIKHTNVCACDYISFMIEFRDKENGKGHEREKKQATRKMTTHKSPSPLDTLFSLVEACDVRYLFEIVSRKNLLHIT